ncbi:MAG: nitroreductase family protein [Candidatus Aminicenantes bacterium]|nr:nitroreductase family protein [Candidatus Aminicenantes bacterium]
MRIIDEIARRRSVREYSEAPVAQECLDSILEAGRLAPTARNQQDWRIIIVADPRIRDRLADEASPHQPFLKQAAIILAACALNPEYVMRCGQPAYPIDLAIVLDHIALQAVREGLGTCWIGSFDEGKAKEVLQVPDPVRIVELMSLGHPHRLPGARPRRPITELYRWNSW